MRPLLRPGTSCVAWSLAFGLAVGLGHPAFATGTDILTGYAITSWTETDAGPLGAVSAIVQDPDGYLWVGSTTGLFRFDGVRFTHWNSLGAAPLPASPVSALRVTRDGSLWVGFANGAGVVRIHGRAQEVFRNPLWRFVMSIVEASDGTLWAVSDLGLFQLTDRTWQRVHIGEGPPEPRIVNAGVTRNGALWVGSPLGLYVRTKDGRFQHRAQDWVWSISEDRAGVTWVTDTVKGFRHDYERTTTNAKVDGNGYRLLHDRNGFLWVATIGEGLWRVGLGPSGHRIEKASLQNGRFNDSVQSFLEDRDDNLWVGTTDGLHRLTRQRLAPVTNVGLVIDAAANDGDLWAGTNYGMVRFSRHGGSWVGRRVGPPHYFFALVRDRRGVLWGGAAEGLSRVEGGRVLPVSLPSNLDVGPVTCLAADARGGLWLGNGARVVHWDHKRVTPLVLPTSAPQPTPTCVYHDSRDRLWLIFPTAQLSVRKGDGTFQHFGPETFGAGANAIYSVSETRDGSVWVASNVGVTRLSGDAVVTFGRSSGLPADRVWTVSDDDEGHIWLSLDVGVVRIALAEFAHAAADPTYRLRYQPFDSSDGLAGAPILNVRAGQGDGGLLWFVRGGALTVGETRLLTAWPSTPPGPARIEGATADDRRYEGPVEASLAPGTKRVAIDYTAIALTQPSRLRFRYKLEGFDSDWVEAGSRRSAVYTNLSPGRYRFVVETATDQDGWRKAPAVWPFVVRPAFYQTAWFLSMGVALTALLVWSAWRFRVGLVRREYAAVLAERTRLSREIHDTLLQGVVGVTLHLDALEHTVGSVSSEVKSALVRTRRHVEAYIRQARQSIGDLRSPLLESRPLPDLLREVGKDLTAGTSTTFSLSVNGRVRRCSPRLENELLRIGQEALTNAVHHARAQHIALEMSYGTEAVALAVTDDGRGIAHERHEATSGEAHYGLIIMRERAENVGGHLHVAPLPEGGTRIEAVLPATWAEA